MKALILVMAAAIAMQAQTRPARTRVRPAAVQSEPKGSFPLVSITVEGNRSLDEKAILSVAGLHTGEQVTKADFDAAQKRLDATGYFRSVGYSYGPAGSGSGYALKLQLQEEPDLYKVMFMDLPASDAELRGLLKKNDPLFVDRAPATRPIVNRYKALVSDYLAKTKNYHDAITGALSPENPPELALIFRPALQATIAELRFTGNQSINTATLQNALAGVAVGSVYSEGRFREMLDLSVRPLYEAQGRIRVAFPKISLAKAPDVNGEIATVQIEEGPVYKLSAVRSTAKPELVKMTGLKIGAPVNFDQVKQAQERIQATYKRRGYLNPRVTVARDIDDKNQTVALDFSVQPGTQYKFGKLDIAGLDVVSEPEIRRMWGLKPGAPFNADYPDHFLSVVREEGVFENLGETKSEQKVHDDTHTVDVTLYFKGSGPKEKKRPAGSDTTTPPPDVGGPFPLNFGPAGPGTRRPPEPRELVGSTGHSALYRDDADGAIGETIHFGAGNPLKVFWVRICGGR